MRLKRKLFARGVVSSINPIFKNKSGVSAVNKALKNNVAVNSGGFKQNLAKGYVGGNTAVSGSNLPKGGLNKPGYLNTSEASLGNNLYTRMKGTHIQGPTNGSFKDVDAVSQLRVGRQSAIGSRIVPNTSGVGHGPLATTSNRPLGDSMHTSMTQKQINRSNLHEAINTRQPGSLLKMKDSVVGQVQGTKAQIAGTRAAQMNPIKQLFGGERKIKSQPLTQLFK